MSNNSEPDERCANCDKFPDPTDGYCECVRPDWDGQCENCEASPVVPVTGLCGPCTFGEADTLGGNW